MCADTEQYWERQANEKMFRLFEFRPHQSQVNCANSQTTTLQLNKIYLHGNVRVTRLRAAKLKQIR